jgi:hypothetical protein
MTALLGRTDRLTWLCSCRRRAAERRSAKVPLESGSAPFGAGRTRARGATVVLAVPFVASRGPRGPDHPPVDAVLAASHRVPGRLELAAPSLACEPSSSELRRHRRDAIPDRHAPACGSSSVPRRAARAASHPRLSEACSRRRRGIEFHLVSPVVLEKGGVLRAVTLERRVATRGEWWESLGVQRPSSCRASWGAWFA